MKLGIVGLPNVGKSTLFNSLTKAGAESANYPFCTIDPNIGIVPVPDKRLDRLRELYNSEKTVPAAIEFVDIAGLVAGASKGEGLGNKFLGHIREVDAIVHVVRCFADDNVVHVDGSVDPLRDIETINLELIFSDLEMIEKRANKTEKSLKSDKSLEKELVVLKKVLAHLNENKCARTIEFDTDDDFELMKSFNLLTSKPVLYAANVMEDELKDEAKDNPMVKSVREFASNEESEVFVVCAKIEEEMSSLDDEDKEMFLEELGITESGLDKLVNASYKILGLISFLTAGPKECRAWTIIKGTKAPAAGGKIHSDIERGFIRAETVAFEDLEKLGTYQLAKEKGLIRSEGKDYVMQDNDIVIFRFNV